jgi:hypothetical protein
MEYKIIENPPQDWVNRLRQGDYVWLVKQKTYAEICFPWIPPEPGHKTGRLGVRHGLLDSWYISSEGRGIDGSLLMLPIEGYLAENPPDKPPHYVYEMQDELRILRQNLTILNQRVMELEFLVYSNSNEEQ